MDIHAAITWVFANHKLVLYGIGGLAVILVAFSLWGLLRGLMRGRSGRRRRMAEHDTLAPAEFQSAPAPGRHGDQIDDDDSYLDDFDDLDDGSLAPALTASATDDFRDIGDAPDMQGEDVELDDFATEDPERFATEDYVDSFGSELGVGGGLAVEPAVQTPEPPALGTIDELAAPAVSRPEPTYKPCTAAPIAPHPAMPTAVPASEDFKVLAEAIFEANFPILHPAAHEEARANVGVFAGMLAEAGQVRLTLEERRRIRGADVQLLLDEMLRNVARRRDEEKYAVLITLLIGRIKHQDERDIVDLLDQSIGVILGLNGVDHLKMVIMCLYLRSINLRSNEIAELENIVKYATNFGQGSNFSNLRTGALFAEGLLMYNAGIDRIEGLILRSYAAMMGIDSTGLDAFPGESPDARRLVYERLNLDESQAMTLDALGQSQCGRATATGIGWATAAAYIEAHTGQPADWERMIR